MAMVKMTTHSLVNSWFAIHYVKGEWEIPTEQVGTDEDMLKLEMAMANKLSKKFSKLLEVEYV